MSGKWNNDQAYYLCRFPTEYALANHVSHPKNVSSERPTCSARSMTGSRRCSPR